MTKAKAVSEVKLVAEEISEFFLEPYVVGPTGVGVLRINVSEHVSAYVSFSYFAKYQSLGAYIGFAPINLKLITDNCLLAVGHQLGLVPRYGISNPCSAVLFPLEFFRQSPDSQPFGLSSGRVAKWVKRVIYEETILKTYNQLKELDHLCEFLASDKAPFSWASTEVPRRLIHVGYLAHQQGKPMDLVADLVRPARYLLSGDADFDGYDGNNLVDLVLQYFYESGPGYSLGY